LISLRIVNITNSVLFILVSQW